MSIDFDDYLDLLQEKDESAFFAVYEATKHGVYSVIVAIVKDRQTTEDLMQDTYIKMLKNLSSYQRGRNFPAWLFQIAKNLAYDHLRKQAPVLITDPQTQEHLFNQTNEPSPSTDYTLEELLKPLDSLQRQIVLLRVVSDVKFKDIAITVGRPLGTVLWIYNQALTKMKNSLGKE
jgi:RNA polymerase sigma-70 factor (ECF subfamily)